MIASAMQKILTLRRNALEIGGNERR